MDLIDRLRDNLVFEDSETAQQECVGMLCVPFKNEDAESVKELWEAMRVLAIKYEIARKGLEDIVKHQKIAVKGHLLSTCSIIANQSLENSKL